MVELKDAATQTQSETAPDSQLQLAHRSDDESSLPDFYQTKFDILPQVRECDYRSFMNNLSLDDPLYAIDVLMAACCEGVCSRPHAATQRKNGMVQRILEWRMSWFC